MDNHTWIVTGMILSFLMVFGIMSLDRGVDQSACMNKYNVSSCEHLYIPNTETDIIEEYTLD